jgi:hypothetical protein
VDGCLVNSKMLKAMSKKPWIWHRGMFREMGMDYWLGKTKEAMDKL